MFVSAQSQLETIHSMMESGHRSVRLERHTLVLWGLAAAFLILTTKEIFTPARFPVKWQMIVLANLFISTVLAIVGIWDFRLTRRARQRRDEMLSFVQRQTTKVLWLIIGLIVAINFGMNFFGGGYLFYGITLALMGIAFYVYGLFSPQPLTGAGLLLIALGLGTVALKLPYRTMEWFAVFTFGVGLPLLGLALDRLPRLGGRWLRALFFGAWSMAIVVPTVAVARLTAPYPSASAVVIAHEDYRARSAAAPPAEIVRLTAGTIVPVEIEMASELLHEPVKARVQARLARDLELSLRDGQLDGYFRVAGAQWRQGQFSLRLTHLEMQSSITPKTGLVASFSTRFSIGD